MGSRLEDAVSAAADEVVVVVVAAPADPIPAAAAEERLPLLVARLPAEPWAIGMIDFELDSIRFDMYAVWFAWP